jgi:hypothetical protein
METRRVAATCLSGRGGARNAAASLFCACRGNVTLDSSMAGQSCSMQRKIPMGDSIAIARHESSDISISIDAHIDSDGGLRLEGNDVGSRVKELLGDSDYEYLIDVPASEIGRLLLLLLKEKYDGDTEAVSKFKTFCESNGIAHSFFNWV